MTLRVEFSICPYGDESGRYEIFRLDISNTGLIEDRGFGHQICSYDAKLFRKSTPVMVESMGYPEWTEEVSTTGVEHDRRDGALQLAMKIIEKIDT